jgi:hypothetical protein
MSTFRHGAPATAQRVLQIQNPKFETNPNDQKRKIPKQALVLDFGIRIFGSVRIFGAPVKSGNNQE